MALDPNNQYLVNVISNLPSLGNRFEKMTLMNYNALADEMRGCFSVVFKAFDRIEQKPVALKFYSLAIGAQNNSYRRAAFRREPEILQILLNERRCLQLICPIDRYALAVPLPGGMAFNVEAEYFATEWLEDNLDVYFLDQQNVDATDKLRLFFDIVLAVEVLHRHGIFHRDLKYDNFKFKIENGKKLVVAIDFGTCAEFASDPLDATYPASQVGARYHSAPEAVCGLAGNRLLGSMTDVYAVGCMLFELFNPGFFFSAIRNANPQFDLRLGAMAGYITSDDESEQVSQWHSALAKFAPGVSSVDIAQLGSSVPPSIQQLLNQVLEALTHLDYRGRQRALEFARGRTNVAMKVLVSAKAQQLALARSRAIRAAKKLRLASKVARLTKPHVS